MTEFGTQVLADEIARLLGAFRIEARDNPDFARILNRLPVPGGYSIGEFSEKANRLSLALGRPDYEAEQVDPTALPFALSAYEEKIVAWMREHNHTGYHTQIEAHKASVRYYIKSSGSNVNPEIIDYYKKQIFEIAQCATDRYEDWATD